MSTFQSPVEVLREAHAACLSDLQALERLATTPAAVRGAELGGRLRALRNDLARQFCLEEQNGYLSPRLQCTPEMDRQSHQLLGEHRQLLQSLDALLSVVEREGAASDLVREKVSKWLGRLQEHHAREYAFFTEARDEEPC
jgi:hypothetical protein